MKKILTMTDWKLKNIFKEYNFYCYSCQGSSGSISFGVSFGKFGFLVKVCKECGDVDTTFVECKHNKIKWENCDECKKWNENGLYIFDFTQRG